MTRKSFVDSSEFQYLKMGILWNLLMLLSGNHKELICIGFAVSMDSIYFSFKPFAQVSYLNKIMSDYYNRK